MEARLGPRGGGAHRPPRGQGLGGRELTQAAGPGSAAWASLVPAAAWRGRLAWRPVRGTQVGLSVTFAHVIYRYNLLCEI